jgi:hypothetical protein
MNWKPKLHPGLLEGLRLCVGSALAINAVVVMFGITYLVMRFTIFSVRFLDRLWFSKPW